jgi:uncharacterized protein (DUF58 family)
MIAGRGLILFAAGVCLWIAARLIGSPELEIIGFGICVTPFLAAGYVRLNKQHLVLRRHLSDSRVAPGARVTVSIEVENRSPGPASFLLIEDRLPAALGRPARIVVSGIRAHATEKASYVVIPSVRGRYKLGPLSVDLSDPFALTRKRLEWDAPDELLVTPEIEDLSGPSGVRSGPSFGASRTRQLFRTGEEYYTMREYHEGDDLRRIHWPSVARTGDLMIRQDESSRRASGLIFLDSRSSTLGRTHSPPFERAVSVAATLGMMLVEHGFALKLATADHGPIALTQERFLDELASVSHANSRSIAASLKHLRAGASSETSLILVAGPPSPEELPSLIRSGGGFGPKIAILVYPVDPQTLPPERQAQMEGRASQARHILVRSGWDCLVLPPSMKLKERWHLPVERPLARSV